MSRASSGGNRTEKTTATPFAESRGRPILGFIEIYIFVYEILDKNIHFRLQMSSLEIRGAVLPEKCPHVSGKTSKPETPGCNRGGRRKTSNDSSRSSRRI